MAFIYHIHLSTTHSLLDQITWGFGTIMSFPWESTFSVCLYMLCVNLSQTEWQHLFPFRHTDTHTLVLDIRVGRDTANNLPGYDRKSAWTQSPTPSQQSCMHASLLFCSISFTHSHTLAVPRQGMQIPLISAQLLKACCWHRLSKGSVLSRCVASRWAFCRERHVVVIGTRASAVRWKWGKTGEHFRECWGKSQPNRSKATLVWKMY